MNMKKYIKAFLFVFLLFGLVSFSMNIPAEAAGASLYVSQSTGTYDTGETFSISVGVNPGDLSVDTFEGSLNLNNLSCQSISLASGVSPQSLPSCSNLYFLLGVQGGTSSSKVLFTMQVKAVSSGSASVSISGTDIISDGTSVSSSSSGGAYTVSDLCSCDSWSSWKNGNCNEGGCSSVKRLQTRSRTCNPSVCDQESETRCIEDSSCSSQKTSNNTTYINVEDEDVSDDKEISEEKEKIIKINLPIDNTGKITEIFEKSIFEGKVFIEILEGVSLVLGESGLFPKEITVEEIEKKDLKNLGDNFVDGTFYDFGPDGVSFSSPIKIKIKYNSEIFKEAENEEDIVIKMFDGNEWIPLSTTIDSENNIAKAEVEHFTAFGAFLEKKEKNIPALVGQAKVARYEEKISFLVMLEFIFSFVAVIGFIFYYKKQKPGLAKLKLTRILEFLIIGVFLGTIEGMLLVFFVAGTKIDLIIFLQIFLLILPFAVLGELIVDHPSFWKFFHKQKEK